VIPFTARDEVDMALSRNERLESENRGRKTRNEQKKEGFQIQI
jgi:hypothetical protein